MNSEISHTPSTSAENDSVAVLTTTVDEIAKDWERVDFIKIDAEGAEEEIWFGMSETIARSKNLTVVMEMKNARYRNPEKFIRQIIDDGFRLSHIDYDSQIKSLSFEQCLNERSEEDWMLFLQRVQ